MKKRSAADASSLAIGLSWVAGLSAFGVIAGNATGAVNTCNGPDGYAHIPPAFWPLLAISIVLAIAAPALRPRATAPWLSLAGVVIETLVSFVVLYLGYTCGLWP